MPINTMPISKNASTDIGVPLVKNSGMHKPNTKMAAVTSSR